MVSVTFDPASGLLIALVTYPRGDVHCYASQDGGLNWVFRSAVC